MTASIIFGFTQKPPPAPSLVGFVRRNFSRFLPTGGLYGKIMSKNTLTVQIFCCYIAVLAVKNRFFPN
jgi:hypothetical protein